MRVTNCLKGEAAKYWKRHYEPLTKAKVLTDRDTEGFILLCQTWQRLQALDSTPTDYRAVNAFAKLSKQYECLAKQFGLLPQYRKATNMDIEPAADDDSIEL